MANMTKIKWMKHLKNDWTPGTWVIIWEYQERDFQWIPTWQGLYAFQKSLCTSALDESSLSIAKVKPVLHPDSG